MFIDFVYLYSISIVLTIVVSLFVIGLLLRYYSKFEILINSNEIVFSKKVGKITFLDWKIEVDNISQINPKMFLINEHQTSETEIELLESFDDDCLLIKGQERELRLGNEKSSKKIFESLQVVLEELFPEFMSN
ncbi:hypothetical protein M23134_01260 [Microscilla marina ATCC 23134]|uniref:Uncharacterized protein n=2 Tax=Microscilla marina TaxID=1027 RepID=A2A0G3_MICM2|nr:hypothetical protein M23134_01260 [Microscilla marina ATCC 23134]